MTGLGRLLRTKVLEIVLAELALCIPLGLLIHDVFMALRSTLPIAMFLMLLQPMYSIDVSALRSGHGRRARFLALVLLLYLVAAPLITLGLVAAWRLLLPAETLSLLLGVVIVELSPVAMPAPAFTAMAGGDVELSVLSVVSTFALAPVALPAYAAAMLHRVVHVPVWPLVKSIVLYIAAPFAVGQALRRLVIRAAESPVEAREELALLNQRLAVLSCAALYWLVGVVFGVAAPKIVALASAVAEAVLLIFAFTAARFLVAKLVSMAAGLGRREEVALVFAASANGALGTALALAAFGADAGAGAVIAGPVVMLLTMIIVMRLYMARGREKS